MKKIKLLLLTLCVVASATMYSACSDEISSGDAEGSGILSGEVVSADGEVSDVVSGDVSSLSEEASSEVSTEVSGELSEELSAEVSGELSEEASTEVSGESSEEISIDASEEVSEEVSSESASSEETEVSDGEQGGGLDVFTSILDAIPEEYRSLDGAKAIESFVEKYGMKSVISVKGEIAMGTAKMGAEYIMAIDCTGETVKSSLRSVMSMSGAVMSDTQSIFMGENFIQVDHVQKNYYYSDVGSSFPLDFGFLDKIIDVETKNELVGTEVFVADWFKSADGDVGIFTQKGELKYFCLRMGSGQNVTELLFKIDASENVDSGIFEIPADYIEINKV